MFKDTFKTTQSKLFSKFINLVQYTECAVCQVLPCLVWGQRQEALMSQAPTSVDILDMILAFDYTLAWLELQRKAVTSGNEEEQRFEDSVLNTVLAYHERDQHPITSHQNPHMEAHTWSHQWGDGGRVPEIQDYPQLYSLNHTRP